MLMASDNISDFLSVSYSDFFFTDVFSGKIIMAMLLSYGYSIAKQCYGYSISKQRYGYSIAKKYWWANLKILVIFLGMLTACDLIGGNI